MRATASLAAAVLALSQSVLSNTRDGGSGGGSTTPERKRKKPKPATPRQLRALRFAPDPAVTQADNARLAEVLLASCPPERTGCPADHAAIIAKHLPTGAFRDSFGGTVEDLLRGSRHNVADAVAGFLVLVWLTQRAEPGRDAGLTSRQTAETLANVAQHGINLQYTYLALGEPGMAEEVSGYLREIAEDWLSVDVADLRLTRRGFVRG